MPLNTIISYIAFGTLDAMGANFINSCLEQFCQHVVLGQNYPAFTEENIEVVVYHPFQLRTQLFGHVPSPKVALLMN
jgi:hypothetical protein